MVQARLRRGARQQTVHGISGEVVGEVARCQEAGSQICNVDRANFPRRPGEEAHEHSAQGKMGEVIESKLPKAQAFRVGDSRVLGWSYGKSSLDTSYQKHSNLWQKYLKVVERKSRAEKSAQRSNRQK